MKLHYTALYVGLIILVNWMFTVVPLVDLPGGEKWPPASLIVGFIFVARDFAQREIGHKVIVAMLLGGIASYFMADPFVAMASISAFLISEFIDWAIYSVTKKTFAQRILISSLISTPIDSAIFLYMIGHASVAGIIIMTISKLVGAVIVWNLVRRRSEETSANP